MTSRILREIRSLQNSPPPGISLLSHDHTSSILAQIEGPTATAFEGCSFNVRLTFPNDFPRSPPTAMFETSIFHPNISVEGNVCVNTLKRDWTSETTVSKVLHIISCLLIEPFPESALNETAARLALHDYAEYVRRAKLHSKVHAQSKTSEQQVAKTSSSTQSKKKRLSRL
ncbi:hypothetical protein GEMRC1_003357 [Eukaryota sp. GEM-RC1]